MNLFFPAIPGNSALAVSPAKTAVFGVRPPSGTGSLLPMLSARLTFCWRSRGMTQASWDWLFCTSCSLRSALPLCWVQFQVRGVSFGPKIKTTNKQNTPWTSQNVLAAAPFHCFVPAWVPSSPTSFEFIYVGSKQTTTLWGWKEAISKVEFRSPWALERLFWLNFTSI